MLRKLIVIALILGVSMAVKEAAAFEMLENFFDKLDLGYEEGAVIGVGVSYTTQPYIDVDGKVSPVPMISAQYKNFFVDGATLGYYLYDDEKIRFAAVGTPRLWGYEPDDSSALVGMTKRGFSFDMGLQGTFETEWFTTELTLLSDVSNEHGGQEVSFFIKREFLQGGLTPRAGVKWHSDHLVDHYFGVNGTEVRAGRPAYDADAEVSPVIGATLALPIGEKWAWVTDGSVQFLGDEIQDSPIVEDETICNIVTGLVYRY